MAFQTHRLGVIIMELSYAGLPITTEDACRLLVQQAIKDGAVWASDDGYLHVNWSGSGMHYEGMAMLLDSMFDGEDVETK